MKKDLQDRAVLNEREYFDDRIAKSKVDLVPVIDWIKPSFRADPSLNPFTAFSKGMLSRCFFNISIRQLIIALMLNSVPLDISLRCSSIK